MTHPTDTDSIEAAIERDRASLASTIGALQDRVSVEHLAQEALGLVKTNAAAYTRSIDSAVRSNPLALALTGVGIAWLIFGSKSTSGERARTAINRREDEGGTPQLDSGTAVAMSRSLQTDDRAEDDDWSREVDTLRVRASAKIRRIEEDARRHASEIGGGISGGLDRAREFAAERAEVLSGFAEDMKRGFRKGLDNLTETGRESIIAAREQAYAARIRAQNVARGGTREAGRLIEDHPLVAGVIALAAGAAFAAALPRTRMEDRTFGAESDRLMNEANRLLRMERERVKRVAAGVADELRESTRAAADAVSNEVKEASRTVATAVSEKVAGTAEAVKERAAREADNTSLAQPADADRKSTATT